MTYLPRDERIRKLLRAYVPAAELPAALGLLDSLVRSRDLWREMATKPPALPFDDVVASLAMRAEHPDGLVAPTWPPDEDTPPDPLPDTEETPVTANAGTAWVELYPTSRSVDDLVEPFRRNVRRFIAELNARGCTARISATLRPPERAWLMRQAWDIVHRDLKPADVPRHPDIDIVWSVEGAREMVEAYCIVHRPSLTSRHIQGRAIDMAVTGWSGTADELHALGATFGVRKLVSDPPHWSDDGR